MDKKKHLVTHTHTFYPLECDAECHQHTCVLFKMPLKWKTQEVWQWGWNNAVKTATDPGLSKHISAQGKYPHTQPYFSFNSSLTTAFWGHHWGGRGLTHSPASVLGLRIGLTRLYFGFCSTFRAAWPLYQMLACHNLYASEHFALPAEGSCWNLFSCLLQPCQLPETKVSHHGALPVSAWGAAFWKVSAAPGVAFAVVQQLRAPTAATSSAPGAAGAASSLCSASASGWMFSVWGGVGR